MQLFCTPCLYTWGSCTMQSRTRGSKVHCVDIGLNYPQNHLQVLNIVMVAVRAFKPKKMMILPVNTFPLIVCPSPLLREMKSMWKYKFTSGNLTLPTCEWWQWFHSHRKDPFSNSNFKGLCDRVLVRAVFVYSKMPLTSFNAYFFQLDKFGYQSDFAIAIHKLISFAQELCLLENTIRLQEEFGQELS